MVYVAPPAEPIAIVGSSCRFPGHSSSPSKLWELLINPQDLSKEVPESRFNIAGFYHPDGEHHGTTNAPKSYWLEEDHRVFDASFFNITPKEAEAIDPQQKILLEVVYDAMETAGFPLQEYSGKKVAVFVGTMTADYDGLTQKDEQTSSQYCATGTSRAIISNRISYFFNWQGASMTIDTACSSSLVAIHQAVLGLRGGESSVACVAGANVMLGPENFIAEASLHMLSPTGKSRMWDANADGYARGEGVAAVFLKTLSKALADGDTIEGIIRETGVNSDGRTKGITMPSSEAQGALIEDTYRKSGLDPRNSFDRCQYFEAHGTGTQAGDPREAGAIYKAFFDEPKFEEDYVDESKTLLVGSIKTIIGHTEGAAGIAGLLKVALAMKHQFIPPNQHLETLNPSIKPFYKHLRVPTDLKPWPSVPAGHPLRSSVNSFGFGGTNAHAILERYEPSIHDVCVGWNASKYLQTVSEKPTGPIMPKLPLLLSANSEKTLASTVQNYSAYLKANPTVNLQDLMWTLSSRRTVLPHTIAFTGLSVEDLTGKMDKQLKMFSETPGTGFGTRSKPASNPSRVLGVFTGQGAQWASMSKDLLLSSELFQRTIENLQRFLDNCPDPPAWSIKKELLASPAESRISEAIFSQPLCTALQIALVDLLKATGVVFHGVVGHSSGEIAAAYAAGVLTAKDAILIAYYRGFHAKVAGGPNGEKGNMMAAGLGVEDAIDFCDQPYLRGRVFIAASNAPASVTLSGDKEAIEEAKKDLDDRGKFARMLQVDTAYHSHHMDRCGGPYVHSLRTCGIRAGSTDDSCKWVSSVYGPAGDPSTDELSGTYWRDNMVQAVLFTEAVERILNERGPFDAALEIGPHPALKGPTTQTVKDVIGSALPYSGTLSRGNNDVVAFGDCLAFLWTLPVPAPIDFESYAATFATENIAPARVVKDLPSYPWDHSQSHFRESRLARQYLNKNAYPHELLGVRSPEDSEQELRWRNILKPKTIPWLKDHKFQGQIIVPAAAYCIMALDAARVLATGQPIAMVELQDLDISSAISILEDGPGVETIFTLKPAPETRSVHEGQVMEATLMLSYTPVEGHMPMRLAVSGRVLVYIGTSKSDLLPSRPQEKSEMNPVDLDAFYSSMQDIGLGYSGPFRALESIERRMNVSTATLRKPHAMDTCELNVRPTFLDVCFQAAFAAFAAPGDGALWTSFLPQKIHRIRFNLALCEVRPGQQSMLNIDAYITEFCPTTSEKQANFSGDIEVFNTSGEMEIQIEGMNVASFAASSKADDRELYLHTVWDVDPMSEIVGPSDSEESASDHTLVESCERVARFYLSSSQPQALLETTSLARRRPFHTSYAGYSHLSTSRNLDTRDSIDHLIRVSPHRAVLNFIRSCGENMPSIIPGVLDHAIHEGLEFLEFNHHFERVVKQITHRYPRMRILEIGLDQEATTMVLQSLDFPCYSYTLAAIDIGPSDRLVTSSRDGKVIHRGYDVNQSALDQGFSAHSYDLVVISSTLHNKDSLDHILKDIHQLIRPGGYLLALDSSNELLRHRFMRCGSSFPEPVSKPVPIAWDQRLASAGFGAPKYTYKQTCDGLSLTVCQTNNEYTEMLQDPLQALPLASMSGNVLIVGGKKSETKQIAQKLASLLSKWEGLIIIVESFEDIDSQVLSSVRAAVILADLDESVIATMNAQKLKNIQNLFGPNRQVLWLVSGFRSDNPYHNSSVGLGRCIKAETPQLHLQFLDLDVVANSEKLIAEAFVRLAMADSHDLEDQLWTTEHEIAVENSRMLIPRILPLEAPNNRLNSIRRVISTEVNVLDCPVELVGSRTKAGITYTARRVGGLGPNHQASHNHLEIRVKHSSLSAIKVGNNAYFHICLGETTSTKQKFVALSVSNSSYITVPLAWTYAVSVDVGQEEMLLGLTMRFLVALIFADKATSGTILLVEPDALFAYAVKNLRSAATHRVLCFTTDPHQEEERSSWIHIHPQDSARKIASQVPPAPLSLIDLSSEEHKLPSVLESCLPAGAKNYPKSSLFRLTGTCNLELNPESLTASLKEAILLSEQAMRTQSIPRSRPSVAPIRDFMENGKRPLMEIVNWTETISVPELQTQTNPSTVFSGSGTYLLVGLTGELGQSLSKMMALNGVRYLVIASRNPNKEPKWQDELQAMGAKVLIERLDVADIDDVVRLREGLARVMPPIAGIVNGAMVLSDGLFADMSLESFERVLRPKVQGSKNLDRAFYSAKLEFFIMFSSLTAVAGNRGQSNYAAANMYMAGLAAQRRKRGLAASVLDIGMLYGIGYINRVEGVEIYNNLRKQGYRPISEQDIHHMFIETVLAGRPTSGQDPELTTGLQRFSASDKMPLHWHCNPRFSHHTFESGNLLEVETGLATESVKQQLRATSSAEEASEVLRRSFAASLELMLQLPPNSINKDVPIIELGVDSLVAVEIRTWFMKEAGKDVPVLKVLGGSTLANRMIPPNLTNKILTGLVCDEIATEISADNATDKAISAEAAMETGSDPGTLGESSLASKAASTGDENPATPLTIYSDDELEEEVPDFAEKLFQITTKMSYGQARLWFPFLYLEDKTAYNCTTSYRIKGLLDIDRFEKGLFSVIQRHQVFRMSFYTHPSTGHAMQGVSSLSPFRLKKVSPANDGEDLRRETDQVSKHYYDLEAGDVFIATLLTHEPGSHTIVFGYHHIMIDAVSWQLFLQDLEKFYSMETPGLGPASRYTDFSVKQRRLMESGGGQDKRNYWRSEFSDFPPPLPLFPFAKANTRKNLVRYDTKEFFVLLDSKLVECVKKASISAKTTTFHFYLAVLQVLLHRFLDIDDMCVGITDANRNDPAFVKTVGFLLESLPLRFKVNGDEKFLDRLQNTRSKVYAALGNSGIPLDVILEDVNVTTSSNLLPLTQILVNYRMGALKQKTMGDVQLDYLAYEDAKHPFDFILSIDEDEGAAGLSLSMQDYLYDQTGGDLFLETYVHLLEAFSSDASQPLDGISLFHERQTTSAVALSTGPNRPVVWPETLSLRVDSMVEETPDSLAIKDPTGDTMTYREIDERSNAIALELQNRGSHIGSRIGLFCEPCADAICSLLAILRIGAVYIPLDVRNSDERLGTIINESEAENVIAHSKTKDRVQSFELADSKVLDISNIGKRATKAVPNQSTGAGHAFIMWTSGSTGKPKGIILTHSNFLTHVIAATETMGIKKERVLQQSAFGYDASLAQIFYALANGGTLIISNNRREMSEIAALMLQEEITFTLCAPSEYTVLFQFGDSLLSRCKSWRIAMCGGEAFPSQLKSRFDAIGSSQLEVFNAYGPTEISVASNIGLVEYRGSQHQDNSRVPIGRAMPNYATYILDEDSGPVPFGWVGEICVGGSAVSSGYLGNSALTKSKFIPDLISQARNQTLSAGRGTIYRTGDKGRMLSDGSIEYHGRIDGDSQIKLRGIRIELDDIASSILWSSDKLIVSTAVILREEGEKFLIAYVVFDPDKAPDRKEQYLKQLLLKLPLPVYMRPAVAIPLDRLPMNASGKLDTKLLKILPLPQIRESEDDFGNLTEAESELKAIWEDILPHTGIEIGKSSNFFSVGGNSLLLLALQAEILKVFEKNVSLPELFQSSTLESLALKVKRDATSPTGSISPTTKSSILGVDWEAETSLGPDLISSISHSKPRRGRGDARRPLTIVLTGATGFLGRAILQELEKSKSIVHIHCIAVRQNFSNIALTMGRTSPKITYLSGDLSLPQLGLAEEEARLLFEDADAIIHNGADVSFMKTFQSLRAPNVKSTKELVQSIAHRRIPFHYVSTAGVVHLAGLDTFDQDSVAPYLPPTDGSDGYVASKWASERYLEKANEQLNLPVWIYRPSSITGAGAPPMDVMQNVLKYSRDMEAVPDLTGWNGYFDFIDVHSVARGLVSNVLFNKRPLQQSVDYIHPSGELVVPVIGVKAHLEKETGKPFRVLTMKEWVAAAMMMGLDQLVAAYLNTLGVEEELPKMPRLLTRWKHS